MIEAFGGGCTFTGEPGADRGKRMSNPATRSALGWEPQYASFQAFMAQGGRDWFSEHAEVAPAGAKHAP